MAKLRKAVCYRKLKMPYTRKSKKRELSYVRGAPYSKIVIFDMGNKKAKFTHRVSLVAKNQFQFRHNALEATRISVNKKLAKKIGDSNFFFKVKVYPHHVLRENATASGAGADRFSSGMAHSFGKPIGLAAQIRCGQEVMYIETDEKNINFAKDAFKQVMCKSPIKGQIDINKI